jgi:hypothetical protein
MKISQVSNLLKICNSLQNISMNVKVAYKFAKIKAKLQEDEQFYTTKMQEIVARYAEVDEEGNYIFTENGTAIKIKAGMTEECQNAINELDSLEIEMPSVTFTLEELDNLDLTLNQMELLMNFIEE